MPDHAMSTRVKESDLEPEIAVELHDGIAHLEAAFVKLSTVTSNTLNPLSDEAQKWVDAITSIIADAREWHDEATEAQGADGEPSDG